MALKNNYEDLENLRDGYYYKCKREKTEQLMAVADLERKKDIELVKKLLPEKVKIVYSDPPWNPGNRKYWRTKADEDHDGNYNSFLDKWCGMVGYCIQNKETEHIFTEQSNNDEHRSLFLDAVDRCDTWTLPLSEKYKVFYGSPGSRSKQRPNSLMYFSENDLNTNPSGLEGEPMTIRTCAGVDVEFNGDNGQEITVFDPCMGKGMTSRMALYFQWNCVGTELNPKRLGKAITWLERHDFEVEKVRLDDDIE